MKLIVLLIALVFVAFNASTQTCEEIMDFVKSESYGYTYNSFNSTAISKVTFYTVRIDYKSYYFAIVCFKPNEYSYSCNEYIYQVGSNTKMYYSMYYLESAGSAFWDYIQPYADNLGCGPSFN